MNQSRILEQLNKMVSSGRVTDDEAVRLRLAEGTDAFDEVVNEIRMRHASAHLAQSVADGGITDEESQGYLEQIRHGEHPKDLRSRLGRRR
ncbi:MAG TPA: hypothetical protein VGH31_11370 [Acidimicrobiales bacterium]|jgi:hypothetical protein